MNIKKTNKQTKLKKNKTKQKQNKIISDKVYFVKGGSKLLSKNCDEYQIGRGRNGHNLTIM